MGNASAGEQCRAGRDPTGGRSDPPARRTGCYVDGVKAGAFGVMSQGELHALALALFLPRATAPESPFRFVVLDDPIQAMDPTKVEGFVTVMQKLAVDRQVIVLSHDDRLPAAVRRSGGNARILQVTRGIGSAVSIEDDHHPSSRYLDDAFAFAKDDNVPDEAKSIGGGRTCAVWVWKTTALHCFPRGSRPPGSARRPSRGSGPMRPPSNSVWGWPSTWTRLLRSTPG